MRPSSHVLRFIAVLPSLLIKLASALAIQPHLIPRQLDDFALLTSELQTPVTGVVRKHYVAIEEIIWDYSPDQWDHYHNTSLSDSPAKLWTHQSKFQHSDMISYSLLDPKKLFFRHNDPRHPISQGSISRI
jgi:hypothetical protein